MTLRTRNVLFIACAVLFLFTAILTFFYSLGWRFDFGRAKITQPGIFYFKIWPKTVSIYIDGTLKKKTDFLFGSAMIENLAAKQYNVELKKDGFFTWAKTLEIRAREATELKNIILIPVNPGFTQAGNGIENIFASNSGKIVLAEEKNSDGWDVKSFSPSFSANSKTIFSSSKLLAEYNKTNEKRSGIELTGITFSEDDKYLLINCQMLDRFGANYLEAQNSAYFLFDMAKNSAALIYTGETNNVKDVEFLPNNFTSFIVSQNNEAINGAEILKKLGLNGKKPAILVNNSLAHRISNTGNIYFIDDKGWLIKSNLDFTQQDKLNDTPIKVSRANSYELFIYNGEIFLKENFNLYYFNAKTKEMQKISESVRDITVSPDGKKLAYYNNYEINILFLDKKYDQPEKIFGDKVFISRYSEKISNLYWYTDYYIIYNAGDKIKVAEIDDRDRVNIVDLASFKNPNIFWNQSDKKLYVLTENNLYISDKLQP